MNGSFSQGRKRFLTFYQNNAGLSPRGRPRIVLLRERLRNDDPDSVYRKKVQEVKPRAYGRCLRTRKCPCAGINIIDISHHRKGVKTACRRKYAPFLPSLWKISPDSPPFRCTFSRARVIMDISVTAVIRSETIMRNLQIRRLSCQKR